jgi:hypothetical protein
VGDKVLVFVGGLDSTETAGLKGKRGGLRGVRGPNLAEVSVEGLKNNVRRFIESVKEILSDPSPAVADKDAVHLKTFDVAVAISGEGQVGFLGTGAKAGASATLTLHFETK